MTLKDVDGLLKQYAFVSVENYNIVGVGNSISEARNNYYSALKSNGILSKGEQVSNEVTGKVDHQYDNWIEYFSLKKVYHSYPLPSNFLVNFSF